MCFVPTCEEKGELLIQVQLFKYEVFQCIKASVDSLKVAVCLFIYALKNEKFESCTSQPIKDDYVLVKLTDWKVYFCKVAI